MKKTFLSVLMVLLLLTLVGCGHEHQYSEEVTKPTCTEGGYTVFTCECGDTYKGAEVEALGHSFSDWTVTKEATEKEEGKKERTCTACNKYEEETIPVKEHVHNYKDTVVEATCTTDGYTEYKCQCGDTYQDNVVPAGHKEVVLEAKAATCTEDGLTEGKKCSACGYVFVEQIKIDATGHKFGDWTVVKESTVTEEGVRERACSVCQEKETESLEKLDDPNAATYTVNYDLDGGMFVGGYKTTEEIGDAFYNDFIYYSNGTYAIESTVKEPQKDLFQNQSHPSVKTALANSEMLAKWNWLWVYMLAHLQEYNEGKTSSYITDTYPVLQKMINGDTTAINDSANARTSIRSYLHGLINTMKGCGDDNPTFSAYSPDFSDPAVQEEFLKHQYNLTETLANGAELPQPIKEGYVFKGWENKYGKVIDKASCNGNLKAVWEETNPVKKLEITNKVEEVALYETYQLEWALTPADAGEKRVKFKSSDESIATVDENGLITTHKVGTVMITATSLSKDAPADTVTLKVVTPGYFEISYETVSYVLVGSEIKLNATYIDKDNKANEVEWKSLDESLATVDEKGYVIGKAVGVATIRATVKGDATKYQDFIVTVLDEELNEALNLILSAHNSNVFVKYELGIGAGTPNYYADIFGSISDLLYNKELEIDYTYNQATNNKYGDKLQDRVMDSIEFVTVHYTAGFNPTAGAKAHGEYFAQPLSSNSTSIHYSTGNDGIYKGMDEQYAAAHAGDGGATDADYFFGWTDTNVEVLDTDPEFPVTTITANGTFAINGRDTGVKVPEEKQYGRGFVTDSKWLNDQGIAVNVKDGKYQIGTTYWCYSQVAEGRICSKGGNGNSIGIESAVNKGSDLWYTWQITAQLVADIMERHGLDITKVKGHHFFSAKDCPQPMLENDMEIWWEFIDMVKAEYAKIQLGEGYTFAFECDSDLVNDKGRVTGQDLTSQVVTYKVTVTKDGKTQTVELASIISGSYNK